MPPPSFGLHNLSANLLVDLEVYHYLSHLEVDHEVHLQFNLWVDYKAVVPRSELSRRLTNSSEKYVFGE